MVEYYEAMTPALLFISALAADPATAGTRHCSISGSTSGASPADVSVNDTIIDERPNSVDTRGDLAILEPLLFTLADRLSLCGMGTCPGPATWAVPTSRLRHARAVRGPRANVLLLRFGYSMYS